MGRFNGAFESQTAQLSGAPVTTTFNGYFGAVVAGAAANFKLRRLRFGIRAAGVPTSQQVTIGIYPQTVRVVGTGFSTRVGRNMDPRGAASAITGIDFTTAATAGTTGPTIAANAFDEVTFNTQSGYDIPFEMLEELICDQGTANGFAFVNLGNTLPTGHLITAAFEWEE